MKWAVVSVGRTPPIPLVAPMTSTVSDISTKLGIVSGSGGKTFYLKADVIGSPTAAGCVIEIIQ